MRYGTKKTFNNNFVTIDFIKQAEVAAPNHKAAEILIRTGTLTQLNKTQLKTKKAPQYILLKCLAILTFCFIYIYLFPILSGTVMLPSFALLLYFTNLNGNVV